MPDIFVNDRGESLAKIEPMVVSQKSPLFIPLCDLAIELAAKSAAYRSSLPDSIESALVSLMRSTNSYYSNLIEGHNTQVVSVEGGFKSGMPPNSQSRDLRQEARAHIQVQQWIDEGGLAQRSTSVNGILDVHRMFCEQLPLSLLEINLPGSDEAELLQPGVIRQHDVKVGQFFAVSPGSVPRFLAHYEQSYRSHGRLESILAIACAHYRLLWIHPFIDANGRVARLISHAMLLDTLDTGGLWSIARGLARNQQEYKQLLRVCDQSQQHGNNRMVEDALAKFSLFFLKTCIKEIDFMQHTIQPKRLLHRISIWAEEEIRAKTLPPKSTILLDAMLYRGTLERSEVASLLGISDRHARRITSALLKHGVLLANSSRAPLHLAIPVQLGARWIPGLIPDQGR